MEASLISEVLIGPTYVPSARDKGNDSVWADGKKFHKFLKNAGFYLATRNPPVVQVEIISGYMDCLLELGELEFPLALTVKWPRW